MLDIKNNIVLWLVFQACVLQADPIGKNVLSDIAKAGQELLSKYPPAEYQYVFIGRSPTPIAAYVEAALGRKSYQIPFSMLDYAEPENEYAGLKFHLERYLPHEGEPKRKILVIDYALSGGSIENAQEFIEKYYAEVSPGTEVKALAFIGSVSLPRRVPRGMSSDELKRAFKRMWKNNRISYENRVPTHIDTVKLPEALARKMHKRGFGDYAKYGKFEIDSSPRKLKRLSKLYLSQENKKYDKLVSRCVKLLGLSQ